MRGGVTREIILAAALVGTMSAVVLWGTFSAGCGPEAEASGTGSSGSAPSSTSSTGGGGTTGWPGPASDITEAEWAEYVANGTRLYGTTCVACHGPGATGMPGLGKALVNNAFVQSLDDEALLAFIQKGRDPSDPLNTTGIGMPAKGGNPALSEDDILDIIAYLRTLQGG
jgi:disulfide bond formation protein DsbB